MPEGNSAFLAAELGGEVSEIDIHGMDRRSAVEALDAFVQQAFMRGDSILRIIHGRGEGVLREEVTKWLEGHELVEMSQSSTNPSETGAVILIKLANKK